MNTDNRTNEPSEAQIWRAVSETKPKIKKCNCMPTCSHKFCGCAAHY